MTVRVTAAESGAPLQAALVSLLDSDGDARGRALTDAGGRAVLTPPAAGTYRIRAELIGREGVASDPFPYGAGRAVPLTVSLSLPVLALALDEIVVEAERRCSVRPDQATELAKAWEEARKSLAVQGLAEREGRYRLDISVHERDLDPDSRRVLTENRRERTLVTRIPFQGPDGETLRNVGFVRRLGGGALEYYGPDAAILLSDAFLDTHCFSLTRSPEVPGGLGVSFEPTSGDRPDVAGTLWLDEESAALRFLEYRYTWAPYAEVEGLARGRVEFEALPDGAWIVRRWWIRVPMLARDLSMAGPNDSGIRVTALRETGGEVLGIATPDRRTLSRAEHGAVRGLVWDSTAAAPLAGATVDLQGTSYRAETDEDGRFEIRDLPRGVFAASFHHPRLDTLGIELPPREVEVTPPGTAVVTLAVPSEGAILLASCVAQGLGEESGTGITGQAVLSGGVRDLRTGEPLPGAVVQLTWDVDDATPGPRSLEVLTDEAGRFATCGVPAGATVRVRAEFFERMGPEAETIVAEGAHRDLDLMVDLPPELTPGARRGEAFGVQGVQGLLLERETGVPVRTAAVSLLRGSGEVIASGVTDDEGFFRLATPTPGPYVLTARALGYREVTGERIDVELGKLSVVEIRTPAEAFEMEPLVVTAEARSYQLEMAGFYERAERGFGRFLEPEDFERRNPRRASDMFVGVGGVVVVEPSTGVGGRAVYFRSGVRAGQICWPMVFLDRHLISVGGISGADPTAIDDAVHGQDIWAMEIYRSPAEVPSEFNGSNGGCGVVVLWTRRGGGE